MNVTLSPKNIRTLLPIFVDVKGVPSAQITISPLDKNSPLTPFQIDTTPLDQHLRGTFWLEHPGHYEVIVKGSTSEISKIPIHIEEQRFLHFSSEFGLFSLFLTLVAGGLVLWFKKQKKLA